jgi:hypothetical protein
MINTSPVFTAKNETPGRLLWMKLRAFLESTALNGHADAPHILMMEREFYVLLADRRLKVLEPLIVPATATTNKRCMIGIRKDFRDAFALAALEFIKADGKRRFHINLSSQARH